MVASRSIPPPRVPITPVPSVNPASRYDTVSSSALRTSFAACARIACCHLKCNHPPRWEARKQPLSFENQNLSLQTTSACWFLITDCVDSDWAMCPNVGFRAQGSRVRALYWCKVLTLGPQKVKTPRAACTGTKPQLLARYMGCLLMAFTSLHSSRVPFVHFCHHLSSPCPCPCPGLPRLLCSASAPTLLVGDGGVCYLAMHTIQAAQALPTACRPLSEEPEAHNTSGALHDIAAALHCPQKHF